MSVSARRVGHDPLDGARVRLLVDGVPVRGVRRVGPLRRTTEVLVHREGGDPGPGRPLPGRTQFAPVVVELAVEHDRAFEQWAAAVTVPAGQAPPPGFRRTLRVEVLSATGVVVLAYDLHRCWVSEHQALPGLDHAVPEPALHVTVQHEGWVRDWSVPDPPPGPGRRHRRAWAARLGLRALRPTVRAPGAPPAPSG